MFQDIEEKEYIILKQFNALKFLFVKKNWKNEDDTVNKTGDLLDKLNQYS